MLGREVRLPDQMMCPTPSEEAMGRSEHAGELVERLKEAHEFVRNKQKEMRQQDSEEPLLFAPGDKVWLENKRRRKGVNPKLQAKFVGPYEVLQAFPNHTYRIARQGQESVQSEQRLKRYSPAQLPAGRAPRELEPRRGPNMKGARKKKAIEVPAPPPREVQPPPDWAWKIKKEVPEPALARDPDLGPASEPQEEDKEAPRRGSEAVTEVPEVKIESRSRVERKELPSKASQREEMGPSTTNGRPKRPTRPPRYLSDFQLYSVKAHRPVEGKQLWKHNKIVPEQPPARTDGAWTLRMGDNELANQRPQEQEVRSRTCAELEGKIVQLGKVICKDQLCLSEREANCIDKTKVIMADKRSDDRREKDNRNGDGKADRTGDRRERKDGNEDDSSRRRNGENFSKIKSRSSSPVFSHLTEEEEFYLDQLLGEESKPVSRQLPAQNVASACDLVDLLEGAGELAPLSYKEIEKNSIKSVECKNTSNVDVKAVGPSRLTKPSPAGPSCSLGTTGADHGSAVSRPGPTKRIPFKEMTVRDNCVSQPCSSVCTASGAVPPPPGAAGPGLSPPETGREGADPAVEGGATLPRAKGKHKRKKSHKASKRHRDHPPSEPSPLLPELASRAEIDPPSTRQPTSEVGNHIDGEDQSSRKVDAPPSEGFTPILHAPVVGGVSQKRS